MSDTVAIAALRSFFETIRDERHTAENTAERIGNAFLSLLSYITDDDTAPFLRKDKDDITQYLLKLFGGVNIGLNGKDNMISGQSGQGILLGQQGNIEADSLMVRGTMWVFELIYNKLRTMEGDTSFSESGFITDVEMTDYNTYLLTLREEYEGQGIAFAENDVCYSQTHELTSGAVTIKSWFRVYSVDQENMQMVVIRYDDEDVPGGTNYAPLPNSYMTRHGNATDETRQGHFLISTTEKRMEYLIGVTKPIIDESNYYLFIGMPPQGLSFLDGLVINEAQPYIYCRGFIGQNYFRITYNGTPEYTIVDMGVWDSTTEYIHGYSEDRGEYITHQVWYGGCVWRCAVDTATVGNAPRFNNADWVCILGYSNVTIAMVSSEGDCFPLGKTFTTTITAYVKHAEMDLTEDEIGKANIVWMRESTDEGGDEAWNILHAAGKCGLSIDIDSTEDIPSDWETERKVAFKCKVSLPMADVEGNYEVIT
ncbi:MAG: hypothetical protein LUC88_00275 [Prevotella sp.]|nr:hypothetical protein [Prevotella sp.]